MMARGEASFVIVIPTLPMAALPGLAWKRRLIEKASE